MIRNAPQPDAATNLTKAAVTMVATTPTQKYAVKNAEPIAALGMNACHPRAAAGQAVRNAVQTAAMTPKRRYAAPTTEGLATRAGFVCKMDAAAMDIRTVAQINATTLMSRSAANRGIVRGHVRVARSAVLPRKAAMTLRPRCVVLLAHAVSLGAAVRMSAVTRMRNVVVMDTVRQQQQQQQQPRPAPSVQEMRQNSTTRQPSLRVRLLPSLFR